MKAVLVFDVEPGVAPDEAWAAAEAVAASMPEGAAAILHFSEVVVNP